MAVSNKLPTDRASAVIQAGTQIRHISNTSIVTGSYAEISVPIGVFAKSILVQTRNGNAFRLSTTPVGTTYASISGPLAMNIHCEEGELLGYIRAENTSDTLEIIFLD